MRCDASKWRLGTTAIPVYRYTAWYYRHSTWSTLVLALDAVIPARHSLGCPYVTRGLCVVDRTVGACPITGSPRHLTSYLSFSYISTHSLRSHWPFPLCVFLRSVRLRAWVLRQRESHRLVVIRAGQNRNSALQHVHMRLHCFTIFGIAQYCSV